VVVVFVDADDDGDTHDDGDNYDDYGDDKDGDNGNDNTAVCGWCVLLMYVTAPVCVCCVRWLCLFAWLFACLHVV
jgi:hypothetical protein